jgi:putative transposase
MVEYPADYRWSSYRANAQGDASTLITPHAVYLSLDANDAVRLASYRELFRYELEPGMADKIRHATNGNFVLGNEAFAAQVALMLGRRVVPGHSGRPHREDVPKTR